MLPRKISTPQDVLLRTIAGPFLRDGVWPNWHFVQRTLDRHGLDAAEALRSLPRIGAHSRTYGFTGPTGAGGSLPHSQDEIRLTVAASVVLPEFEAQVGRPFLLTLHHLIKVYDAVPLTTQGEDTATITSHELLAAIPSLPPAFLDNIVAFARYEPGINMSLTHTGTTPDGGWTMSFDHSVLRFRSILGVGEYVDAECEIADGWAREMIPSAPAVLADAVSTEPARPRSADGHGAAGDGTPPAGNGYNVVIMGNANGTTFTNAQATGDATTTATTTTAPATPGTDPAPAGREKRRVRLWKFSVDLSVLVTGVCTVPVLILTWLIYKAG